MTKRQLATAYRGYHGLESQYHALLQMSNTSMINTKQKNDQIQLKHVEEMKHLIELENSAKGKTDKDLKAMREDFTAQLAYQYVYKNHSFKRFYKSQKQKKPRPVSDKPEFYDLERKNSAKLSGPRPLGSLRQLEDYRDELQFKFPPIAHHEHTDDITSPRVNMMGEKSYRDLTKEGTEEKHNIAGMTSFPNIEDAMGIQVKFRYKPKDEDRLSTLTAPPAGLDAESADLSSDINSNLINFDMGHNLIQMRQKEKEKLEKRRILPPTPLEVRKESWRRILPETPSRPSTVFHGTKNSSKIKKMMKEEAIDVLSTWDNMSLRREVVEVAKEHHKAVLAENPIPVFDRSRPTSAILRDFREYKKHKESDLAMREQSENDQTMIVRQISPQPRAGSPVAESRNKYMNLGRPGPSREGSPIHMTSLHRTESEKFPSVSRTSSYKEVPGTDNLFQENALLTAAERIELERGKRNQESKPRNVKQATVIPKMKRRLPVVPSASNKKVEHPTTSDAKQLPRETVKMFNTSVLAHDEHTVMIDRVKLANIARLEGHEFPDKGQQTNRNNEHNPYSPITRQQNKNSTHSSPPLIFTDNVTQIKTASALYGKDLWPKLSRKMKFDYENYSRTPPDTKKRLETRAKNRRKIQQKNAQLAEELKMKAKTKAGTTKDDTDRPQTRVSFNENVIVFQTI